MPRLVYAGLAVFALAGPACRIAQDPSLIVAAGHVEATDVRLAAKVPGRLESFKLAEGDVVKAGQELARLDTVDLRLALAQARAERDQAAADLRLRLAGARPEDIAELEAQAAAGRAERDSAGREFERMQGLLDRGSGTTKARDDAAARRDVARARLEALEQALKRARAGFRSEEKDAARARLASAEARLAQIEQQIKDAVVTSPRDGVITEKTAEEGELLQAGSPLCVLTDLGDTWLRVYVAEPDLGRILLGGEAEVRTDGGQVRRGRVTFIASQAEFTPKNVQTRDERVKLVYEVKIGLDNKDGLFKPGMPAEARLRAAAGSPR